MSKITERQYKFAMAYVGVANGNATAAYRLTYDIENKSENEIRAQASRVMQSDAVSGFIAEQQRRVADKFEIARTEILRTWWKIATADPNELIQAQRRCCRFCHGVGFEYQWRDAQEWAETMAAELAAATREKREPNIASDAGGYGFNHTAAPVEECTKCRGDGVVHAQVMDTRYLTPAGRLLYAGVKQTRDGIEIKMRDQDGALANLAKALGIFGESDKPSVSFNFDFSGKATAAEATKLYKQLMG